MPDFLPPYLTYLITALLGCIISIYGVRKTIFIARSRKLYDQPDDVRKIHGKEIPSMGGIGIFVGYVIASAVYWYWCGIFLPFLMASSAMLLFTGIYDDIMNMSPVKKLMAQMVASFVTLAVAVPQVNHYGHVQHHIIELLPWSILATLLCTFFINVFNFIDGIDGLACSLALLYLIVIGLLLLGISQLALAGMAFTLAGATVGLLLFNKAPAKIYMGDTGSMFIGFTIFILSFIYIARVSNSSLSTGGSARFIDDPMAAFNIVISMLSVPVFDAIRVFALRIFRKTSPFRADRTHLHYYLLDAGCTHSQAVAAIVGTNVVCMVVAYLLQSRSLSVVLACCTIINVMVLLFALNARKKRVNA